MVKKKKEEENVTGLFLLVIKINKLITQLNLV